MLHLSDTTFKEAKFEQSLRRCFVKVGLVQYEPVSGPPMFLPYNESRRRGTFTPASIAKPPKVLPDSASLAGMLVEVDPRAGADEDEDEEEWEEEEEEELEHCFFRNKSLIFKFLVFFLFFFK